MRVHEVAFAEGGLDIGPALGVVTEVGGETAYGAADIDFFAYKLRTDDGSGGFDSGAFAPVPEPATMGLMLLGGLAIVGLRRQGKK